MGFILVAFNFGRVPFWSCSILVVFHFWSSSILFVFHFSRLPIWSSFILVVFHFDRLPFWFSSILVIFHCIHLPFLSSTTFVKTFPLSHFDSKTCFDVFVFQSNAGEKEG